MSEELYSKSTGRMTGYEQIDLRKKILDLAPACENWPESCAGWLILAGEISINFRSWECNTGTPYEWRTEEAGLLEYNCSDVFMWGCSDSEALSETDCVDLYKAWKTGKPYATMFWVCKKRNQRPQDAWKKDLEKAGVWNEEWEALPDSAEAHL